MVDVAELLVSELVGNAARYTGCTRLRVHVALQGPVVRVGVRDSSAALPVLLVACDDAENGRGLGLIAALSHRFGVTPEQPGKTVWFELRTDSQRC
ncbi:anti-sigma regulatory factor (Ser/Thr protein kinase) [Kitasatospora sp. MAP12-15]|nr:anti-sigma regulatory factor (Ser/Thr protein kinase) [Kitasatospora sp. MAP12-44]